jgi:hypothetical protein
MFACIFDYKEFNKKNFEVDWVMRYSMTIEYNHADPKYINDIETWGDVLDTLRHRLDQWTIRVHIYKWSSNNRCLGHRCVTMGNLYFVAGSPTDKVLL